MLMTNNLVHWLEKSRLLNKKNQKQQVANLILQSGNCERRFSLFALSGNSSEQNR